MQVYLFRHGQTPGNAESRYLGITNEPLSPQGIETVKAAGSDPTVQEVLVTPLKRTQMTAAILFPHARQRICPGLREMDFGAFEGRSAQEMADDPDYRCWVEQTRCMGPCPHGDARLVFQHRVCAAFRREAEKAIAAGQKRLYFVVHGGVIMSVMDRFAYPEAPYFSWRLNNGEGFRCRVEKASDGLRLVDFVQPDRVAP